MTADHPVIASSYIARKEDLQRCLVDYSPLPVVAVYPDGRTVKTHFISYIRSVSLNQKAGFDVVVDGSNHSVEVTLI